MNRKKAALLTAGSLLALYAYRCTTRFSFRGKSVLITGGSRGLGLVLARKILAQGACVGICARDKEELDRAQADLEPRGEVLALPCDLTDQEQVAAVIRAVEERWGGIDVLINNAGIIRVGPVETMNLADYEDCMKVHYWGPLYAILAALPGMRRRASGRIVNVASIGGKISVPHLLPYDASKFALVGLSEGLRSELKKDNIVVTTICPGLMRTGSPRNADFKSQYQLEYLWFSVSDSLPFFTMSAETAASKIIAAVKRGSAEVVLSLPAKIAAAVHGLFPGAVADLLGLVNRLLPAPGGIGTVHVKGKESQSGLSPSVLTRLTEKAALRNNQVPPEEASEVQSASVG